MLADLTERGLTTDPQFEDFHESVILLSKAGPGILRELISLDRMIDAVKKIR
jgi:hypothetical protein